MISQIIKAAQIKSLRCQWSIKWKMLLRIYKALLLTLFDPFKYLLSGKCSDDALLAKHQTANKGVVAESSNRCLAGNFQTDVCPFFIVAVCQVIVNVGKPVNKTACWDSQENFHQTLQLHATLFTAHWCLFLFLFGHSPVSWFTVMTGRTISGSETTVCCLCRVTTRVTLIYRACFL